MRNVRDAGYSRLQCGMRSLLRRGGFVVFVRSFIHSQSSLQFPASFNDSRAIVLSEATNSNAHGWALALCCPPCACSQKRKQLNAA